MIGEKSENLSPDGGAKTFCNIVNGRVIVKFNDLKGFIKQDRAAKPKHLAEMWGYNASTLTNFMKGRGTYPSCLRIIDLLERHFNVVIEGSPYR